MSECSFDVGQIVVVTRDRIGNEVKKIVMAREFAVNHMELFINSIKASISTRCKIR